MDFTAIITNAVGWFDAHPAGVAWCMGWFAALCAGQIVKQLLWPYRTVTAVKRIVQVVAMLVGGGVAFTLWPDDIEHAKHAIAEAIVCGMSAPTVYTLLKAAIEWRFPRLAYVLSWQRVQDRNGVPSDGAQPEQPPC
jgi:uncharacterized membrane protein AbrB (regulator of aidB expression)